MRVLIVTLILALAIIGMWFGIAGYNVNFAAFNVGIISAEHLLYLFIAVIFLIFVAIIVVSVLRRQLSKEHNDPIE